MVIGVYLFDSERAKKNKKITLPEISLGLLFGGHLVDKSIAFTSSNKNRGNKIPTISTNITQRG